MFLHFIGQKRQIFTALALAGEGERDGAGESLVQGVRGLVVEVGGLVGGAGVASVAAGVRAEGGRLDNVILTISA